MSTNPADVLDMSDAAFLEQGEVFNEPPSQEDSEEAEEERAAAESSQEAEADAEDSADESSDEAESEADDDDDDDDERQESKPNKDPDQEEPESEEKKESEDADSATDLEDFHKKITAPFRANGKEMQINNPDDAIRLMQMGANYNRKMASMKPALKVLKMLERNELLDEKKLSYLIDLNKKEPGAIAKLLKDSKIDPMEFEIDQEYAQSNHAVSDSEVELDTVVDELRDSPTYTRTLEIVANGWDKVSKTHIADNPRLLATLDSQVASGVYDIVSIEVDRERAFGRLSGISDIEAYQLTGDRLHAEGKFNHMIKAPAQQKLRDSSKPHSTRKPHDEVSRRDKRRAASPTRSAPAKGNASAVNPLQLSDAAFEQEFDAKFL